MNALDIKYRDFSIPFAVSGLIAFTCIIFSIKIFGNFSESFYFSTNQILITGILFSALRVIINNILGVTVFYLSQKLKYRLQVRIFENVFKQYSSNKNEAVAVLSAVNPFLFTLSSFMKTFFVSLPTNIIVFVSGIPFLLFCGGHLIIIEAMFLLSVSAFLAIKRSKYRDEAIKSTNAKNLTVTKTLFDKDDAFFISSNGEICPNYKKTILNSLGEERESWLKDGYIDIAIKFLCYFILLSFSVINYIKFGPKFLAASIILRSVSSLGGNIRALITSSRFFMAMLRKIHTNIDEKQILEKKNSDRLIKSEMKSLISVNGYLKFGSKERINIDIEEGDIFCIAGENGCGKSTLCKTIANNISMSSGQIDMSKEISIACLNNKFQCRVSDFEMGKNKIKISMDSEKSYSAVNKLLASHKDNSSFPRSISTLFRILEILEHDNPDIFIGDEIFDVMDLNIVKEIIEIISKKSKALIIVSHREEIMKCANKIFVIPKSTGSCQSMEEILS